MRRYFRILLVVCSGLSPAAATQLGATGLLLNQWVSTSVDAELAKYYLERSTLTAADRNRAHEEWIRKIHGEADARNLDWQLLRDVAEKTSPDFAALYFVRRIQADSESARYQTLFFSEHQCMKDASHCGPDHREAIYGNYKILVVGGFHYKSDTSTGADLAKPRALLQANGFETELVDIDEDGVVEENAAIIARTIQGETKDKSLILVSASKGGPETAYALGKLLASEDTRSVRAWVSIGGILRGTLLADDALRPSKWWWARIGLFFMGVDSKGVRSMTTAERRKRFEDLRFPNHILLVQYIGVPLSGQVSPDVRGRHEQLLPYGPNDGLTLLADELVPGGRVVLEIGLDHYYRDQEIDLKALALANVVKRELSR